MIPGRVEEILRDLRLRDLASRGHPVIGAHPGHRERLAHRRQPAQRRPAKRRAGRRRCSNAVIRTVHYLRQGLNISHYMLFGLRDADSSKPDLFHQFGILRDDYTPKPAITPSGTSSRNSARDPLAARAAEKGNTMNMSTESTTLETRLGPLAYRSSGQGQALVFFAGALANGDLWRDVVAVLEGRYRCITIDLRWERIPGRCHRERTAQPARWPGCCLTASTSSR